MNIRSIAGLATAALLAGCAGIATLRSEVSTFGEWPAGRAPATYAFDRLPSQQARAQTQDLLEASARPALEAAGFRPAAAGGEPDVVVQLGARITRTDLSPWDDPLWWHGSFGYWRLRPWYGPRWRLGVYSDFPRYEREVALLIRDRTSGKPLFEARASSDGSSNGDVSVLRAMFTAALTGFPVADAKPRSVTVPLTQASPDAATAPAPAVTR